MGERQCAQWLLLPLRHEEGRRGGTAPWRGTAVLAPQTVVPEAAAAEAPGSVLETQAPSPPRCDKPARGTHVRGCALPSGPLLCFPCRCQAWSCSAPWLLLCQAHGPFPRALGELQKGRVRACFEGTLHPSKCIPSRSGGQCQPPLLLHPKPVYVRPSSPAWGLWPQLHHISFPSPHTVPLLQARFRSL